MTASTTQQVWQNTLDQLKLQMTQATFNTRVKPCRLLATEANHFSIGVKDAYAAEWLENRLRDTITRTLSNTLGSEATVAFKVIPNGTQHPTTPLDIASEAQPAMIPLIATPEATFAQIDYRKMWFGEGTTGFFMRPLYAEKFWQAYLGRAYSLWSLIQADNRQNKQFWTRPKKYRYKYLARSLGCGFTTIKGGLRPCDRHEKSKMQGEPFSECCGRYRPVDWGYRTADGNHQCMHWNPGLMEKLYHAGLLAIEEKGEADKPRSHILHLQVWTMLPLLTPHQVEKLSDAHQKEHEYWLERVGTQAGFSVSDWESLGAKSLLPLLPDYHSGRELFDVYQPNPLLKPASK